MSKSKQTQLADAEIADPRWRELYIIGGVCGVLMSVLTILAIFIYFIWPYKPGLASPLDIFTTIHNDALAGLMSLDFFMVVIAVITIPFFLALYVALKAVNEAYALIAVVSGMISCLLIFTARPIAEMFNLWRKSSKWRSVRLTLTRWHSRTQPDPDWPSTACIVSATRISSLIRPSPSPTGCERNTLR
ncbi:MAG: hypothetical protein HY870_04400 [Chloroflexi bacterium]|nr:hypothetical protein [Chloroflexota bacterium]